MKEKNNFYLGYGTKAEDEDFLIGTEDGLKHLISACEIALEKGEYNGEIADFIGIKKINGPYPETPEETIWGKLFNRLIAPLILLVVMASLLIGFFTIVNWLSK